MDEAIESKRQGFLNRARVAFCINALLDPALTGVAAQLKATNEESECDVRR